MCDEDAARAALRALGIKNPSPSLVENWIRANRAEEEQEPALAPELFSPRSVELPAQPRAEIFRQRHPRGYSKSNLEPILRKQGTLERPHGIRKPGRPRIIASWFPEVAEAMADGTSLKTALASQGIALTKSELRACYRSKALQVLYQDARKRYLEEQ
jgi:hypothetical protein